MKDERDEQELLAAFRRQAEMVSDVGLLLMRWAGEPGVKLEDLVAIAKEVERARLDRRRNG